MTDASIPPETLITCTADIVAAYVGHNAIPASDLQKLIASVHMALQATFSPVQQKSAPLPAVPVKKSVTPDFLISLEDGRSYKSLKRHLTSLGMTPVEYRTKWGLPPDYPMVAAAYAKQRSDLARASGLGRKRAADIVDAPSLAPARRRARAKSA